jgi:hypothetical protein
MPGRKPHPPANISRIRPARRGDTRSRPATDNHPSPGRSVSPARLRYLIEHLGTMPAPDLEEINRLSRAIRSGSYRIHPERIADRLLELERKLFRR